jgi:hypothetical protein
VARVEWSESAVASLDRLILTHSLPADTRPRVRRSVRHLTRFPRIGPPIPTSGDEEIRFLLGPWRWLIIVYLYIEVEDRVVIVSVEDGRTSAATLTR